MAESSVTSSGAKKKKRNPFKSLGKGLSLKKKKKRPDDDSVVSVSVDRNSASSAPASASASRGAAPTRSVAFADGPALPALRPSGGGPSSSSSSGGGGSGGAVVKPIQVVLLLMDPSSRRFELLQLEFDSNKAMVSDVLRQIQCSATETTLRDMHYVGVADQTGMEMISHMKLSRFCGGNDIVLAIPEGMSARETAKLAGPILGDPKVEDMLAPVGAKVRPKPTKGRSASKLTKISEDEGRRKDRKASSRKGKGASNGSGGGATPKTIKSSSVIPTAALGVIISALVFFTVQRHISVTTPLESGDSLYPGQWKSQCGIFDLVPQQWLEHPLLRKFSSSCDVSSSSMLELGRDGTLRYFTKGDDGERKEKWSVEGGYGEGQCYEEECDECGCDHNEATFLQEGNNWFVEMDGTRTSLSKDVIRDFASES